jgi:hypothetical protein
MGPVDPLDPLTTERLLRGCAHPDDVPQDYREVANLLQTLAGDLDPSRAGDAPPPRFPSRVRRACIRSVGVKTATAVTLVALAGTAAAATGQLPDAVQNGLANAARRVGVHLPVAHSDRPVRKPQTPAVSPANERRPSHAADEATPRSAANGATIGRTSVVTTRASRPVATDVPAAATSLGTQTGPQATTAPSAMRTHPTPTTGRPSEPASDHPQPPTPTSRPAQTPQTRPAPPSTSGGPPVGARAVSAGASADPHR